MKTHTPFLTRSDALYYGSGVIVPADGGGFWSLHGYSTPTGPELYHVGTNGRRDGWPAGSGHIWATPADGGAATICRKA